MIVGDSHVAAIGPLLAAVYGSPIESRKGWSSARYAAEWIPPASARMAPRVLVVLGTNNAGAAGGEARQMARIVEKIRQVSPKAVITWAGPPTVTRASLAPQLDEVAAAQRAAADRLGIRWIDSRPITRGGQLPDQVHRTRAGYAQWADGIKAAASDRDGAVIKGAVGLVAAAGLLWLLSELAE
jgi:lysophospholipase L1-like esterase